MTGPGPTSPGGGGASGGNGAPAGGHAGHGRQRSFGPTNLAVRQRTSVIVMAAIIAILGVAAYRTVPKESSPEIVIPMVSISTVYPGVAPKDIETLVTRVIEEDLNTIPDIKELTSTSVEGYSNIIAEFDVDMDMEEALQKVREKVDLARPDLPADAEEPVIQEFNIAEFPIMQVNISGEYDLVKLKEVAEDLQDRFEQIPSVLEVQFSGGLEREVKVEVDLPKLKFYNLAFTDVVDAIRNENVTVPGGSIDVGHQKYLVRVTGEFQDARVIEGIVVATKEGRPIYVRDVAGVDFGFAERESYARLDGNPVVTLGIVKRAGRNIIETADAVRGAVAELQPGFPPTTVVKITADQSDVIHEVVSSLENNIISGLILVLSVLLFFLGVRNAFFVAVSIPLSMLLSFIVMQAVGFSMNMVVLFSLILALGMLVDNAVVVVENIYRYREQGADNVTAALRGTAEVAGPIIGATLTTLGAFFPLLFWPGIVGEFMGFLPMTLIMTLSSSLFVALVIVPVLCALFMRLEGEAAPPSKPVARWTGIIVAALLLLGIGRANPLTAALLAATGFGLVMLHRLALVRLARWFQDAVLPFLIRAYERRLRWAMGHRILVLAGAAGVFIVTVGVFGALNAGVEFFPEDTPPAAAYVGVDVPDGTNAAFTNSLAEQVERQLGAVPGLSEDAEAVVATVGGGSGAMPPGFGPSGEATVTVSFRDYKDRKHDAFDLLRAMQERIGRGIAGARFTVEKPQDGPASGLPVNVEISGEDPDRLRALADRAVQILETAAVGEKLEGLESDMTRGRPELVVDVDREKAALYGLSTAEVGATIRAAIQGTEAAKFRAGEDEYDIVVRLAEPYRVDLEGLRDLTIMDEGTQIPLPSVATWRVEEGYGTVRRKDLERVATVSSDVRAGLNSNAVLAEVQAALAGFGRELPPGYEMRYTGQQEEQQQAQEFLSFAFLVALMLIGFILVSQFNSVVKPFIIMTSVVMSTVGVLVGLMVFRMPFGIIMTGVGVISLAGVVVNNAIVLIDYIDLLRERDGLSRDEALIRAGMTRFRPVMLTAITTVLGLVPLAIGFNFDFLGLYTALAPDIYWGGDQAAWWGPMAIAVIAGLSFATVLTLVLVPVMYSVVDDVALFLRRHFTRAGGTGADRDHPHREEREVEGAAARGRRRVRAPAAAAMRLRALLRPGQASG